MYRRLEIGEKIEKGDEFWCNYTDEWIVYSLEDVNAGVIVGNNMKARRKDGK